MFCKTAKSKPELVDLPIESNFGKLKMENFSLSKLSRIRCMQQNVSIGGPRRRHPGRSPQTQTNIFSI